MMRKIIYLLFFSTLNSFSFAQSPPTMTINGHPVNPNVYEMNLCVGDTISLDIVVSPNTTVVDSVRIFEYISIDGCNTYGFPVKYTGTNLNWSVPMSGSAQQGYCYKYLVQVYYNHTGSKISGLCRINVIDPPNAQISGNNEICEGEAVTFFASGGSNYEFMVNGGVVPSTGNQCIISSLGDGDIVKVEVTENGCSATSAPITMTVHPLPDVGLIKPSSSSCNDMLNWDYINLTGTGPWVVSFWDPTHIDQYDVDHTVTTASGTINGVQISHGTSFVHVKISDQHCSNF